ncbi:hypothetical protein [Rhodococcus rhodnii]|uniref:hypothetical protein n=1 Tax=Rhodococcus rhodnii TaxID=38312 RepID=UPI0011607F80|nr:hypothetical protein [Rhodococcus rhodnii]
MAAGLAATTSTACRGAEIGPVTTPADSVVWGVSTDANTIRKDREALRAWFDRAAALPISSCRTVADWWLIEDRPGVRDWTSLDMVVDECRGRGLAMTVTVAYAPEWARDPEDRGPRNTAPGREYVTAWAEFCRAVARRVPADSTIEIWNEPNLSAYWGPVQSPVRYGELLKAAHRAVKDAAPGMPVVAGSLGPAATVGTASMSPPDFAGALYDAGFQPYFDALSVHPYTGAQLPSASGAASAVRAGLYPLRDVMVAAGDGSKPILLTEFGTPTGGFDSVGVAEQSAHLLDAMTLWRLLPFVSAAYLYTVDDRDSRSVDREGHFGVYFSDGTPKPSLAALQ